MNWKFKVSGKTAFFTIDLFCTHYSLSLFVLTLASDMAVLYGNDACLVLSAKKWYSSFFENVFLKSIENVPNFHWLSHKNMPISQTEGYFQNP